MTFGTRSTVLEGILHGTLQPGQSAAAPRQLMIAQLIRQGLAVVLSALMIMIPMGQREAFAQSPSPVPGAPSAPPAPDNGQQQAPAPAPQGQALSSEQLGQLVAPIALYPDALVAQVLAASTYPTEVVQADRWRQSQGNAAPEQIAAAADAQNWDPSVKALIAFPTVLAQMDRNLQWTTDLGNAYYNQPQDVMDAVQAMRQKAQTAGQLRTTPQQTVTNEGGAIAIAPANPTVVYVPVYDPWVVYGAPYPMYPGYYYAPPPGIFWGGLAIGFGLGIGVGLFSHWGWGWGHWGMGWHSRSVFYNHTTYFSRSTTVINRGFNRPGGPPRSFAGARGAYSRPGGFNRPGGNYGRPGVGNRGGSGSYGHPGNVARPGGSYNRASASYGRPAAASMARTGSSPARASASRPSAAPASHGSSGGHASSSHSGGGHSSGGGHGGHGR